MTTCHDAAEFREDRLGGAGGGDLHRHRAGHERASPLVRHLAPAHVRGEYGLALVVGVAAARGRASLALVLRA